MQNLNRLETAKFLIKPDVVRAPLLSDYAHLYLGCGCKWTPMGDDEPRYSTVDLNVLNRIFDRQPFNIQLCLRPLSSMTKEEQDEQDYIPEDVYTGGRWLSYFHHATHVKWLLSKHFDLFGLIDAGLAIDEADYSNER